MILAVFGPRSNTIMNELRNYLDALHERTPIERLVTGKSLDGACAVAREWAIRHGIEARLYGLEIGRNARILDENPDLSLVVIVSTSRARYDKDNRHLVFMARLRKIRTFELEIT